ncbi:MAG TPA: hypothetical protein VG916_05605, partial [Gemmatimonadaceae bacterium]|nr:hypothetical protein [Gemmatimonadaceae bacterium]
MRRSVIAVSAAAVLVAPVLAAQGKPKEEAEVVVPESAWPPDGMCRVWLRDVPERQQPAPTDCATALRTRPRDATLLIGEPKKDARLVPDRVTPPDDAGRRSLFDDRAQRGFGIRSMSGRASSMGTTFNGAAPAESRSVDAREARAAATRADVRGPIRADVRAAEPAKM